MANPFIHGDYKRRGSWAAPPHSLLSSPASLLLTHHHRYISPSRSSLPPAWNRLSLEPLPSWFLSPLKTLFFFPLITVICFSSTHCLHCFPLLHYYSSSPNSTQSPLSHFPLAASHTPTLPLPLFKAAKYTVILERLMCCMLSLAELK